MAEYDPQELERIEERLFALRAAGAQIQCPVDGLAALARRYAADLALIDAGAERLAALEREAQAAAARYRVAARGPVGGAPRARRKSSTRRSMPNSSRSSSIARNSRRRSGATSEGPDGIDRVEFWVRTNPGTRPGPLMKSPPGRTCPLPARAQGGARRPRLGADAVFDEIDTGAGGAVADAIGVRLARLAAGVQVIAVTHAPQVAARADRHYLITKDALAKGKRVATRVTELKPSGAARKSPACSPAPKSPPKPALPPSA